MEEKNKKKIKMKKYDVYCPFCQNLLKNCENYVKCNNCKTKIKIIYTIIPCKNCNKQKFISYIQKNDKATYCNNCGHMIKQSKLVAQNILEERLKFKTTIPKDYWTDIQIDLYKIGKGEKI